jgi:hypothetical protein
MIGINLFDDETQRSFLDELQDRQSETKFDLLNLSPPRDSGLM